MCNIVSIPPLLLLSLNDQSDVGAETASNFALSASDSVNVARCRLKVMPLVSREWKAALSNGSVAWEHLELSQPPSNWSKLAHWALKHCKYTQALTVDNIAPGSENELKQLLLSGFDHLTSVRLLGSITTGTSVSSDGVWGPLLRGCKLQSLQIQVDSITQQDLNCLHNATCLQHLSIEAKKSSDVVVPSFISSLNLQSLALRNVHVAIHMFPGDATCQLHSVKELSLVQTGVQLVDFTFGQMRHLTSLLISDDYRPPTALVLANIASLTSLKRLSISSGLEHFPDAILGLSTLTSLDLGWNKFRMLPPGPYLENLQELQFQERSSFLDVNVLEQASCLTLLSFDETDMSYKSIIELVATLIKQLPSLKRMVLLKATYNGAADREDKIAQDFLKLVNMLCTDLPCRRSIQIDLNHKWKPLLWCDEGR